jgi:peptidoglycan/xylan/chitin deacetylase (PgdA/CDA1 family)
LNKNRIPPPLIRARPWARVPAVILLVGSIGAGGAVVLGNEVPAGLPFLLLGCLLLCVLLGTFFMQVGLFARPILGVHEATAEDRLALTFDDGPDPESTREVLRLLEAGGHRATFFVIGRRAIGQQDLLREIVNRGHRLGNHSFAHAHRTAAMPVSELVADLSRADRLLSEVSPARVRWFRPPIGVLSPRVTRAAAQLGLELVGWTRSARDGISTSVGRATARLSSSLRPGAILVLHDGAEQPHRRPIAPSVLRELLPLMEARGLRSVTLDELLSTAEVRHPGSSDESSKMPSWLQKS